MAFIKRISALVGLGLIISAAIIAPVFATGETGPSKKSELDNISQNCTTIKQSLTQLQRADSRTRTYLGSGYERINNTFIAPLSVRLVKNNIVDNELLKIQADFSETQTKFRSAYTDYMRELESLLAVDCAQDPQSFYNRLEIVRERRATLRKTTETLTALAKQQFSAVTKLQEQLK